VFTEPDYPLLFVHRTCVSIGTLYGGHKNQTKNYVRIPPGSAGTVVCGFNNEFQVQYYLVKFKVGTRMLYGKCAGSRLVVVAA
jgi:hypothetical protein